MKLPATLQAMYYTSSRSEAPASNLDGCITNIDGAHV